MPPGSFIPRHCDRCFLADDEAIPDQNEIASPLQHCRARNDEENTVFVLSAQQGEPLFFTLLKGSNGVDRYGIDAVQQGQFIAEPIAENDKRKKARETRFAA